MNQKTILAYARASFSMVQEPDRWGVKFEKDANGEYAVNNPRLKSQALL